MPSPYPVPERFRMFPFHFSASVPANSQVVLEQELNRDCTVEKIAARFYGGQQLALHAEVFRVTPTGDVHSLIHYPTGAKTYLAGEDDKFEFDLSEAIYGTEGEFLRVVFTSTSAVNAYDGVVSVSVDYANGPLPRELMYSAPAI